MKRLPFRPLITDLEFVWASAAKDALLCASAG
jgi:hypothetical protein